MRYLRLGLPSRPTVFAILMAASAVVVLLPSDLLRPARDMTQLMAPLQLATRQAVQGAAGPIRRLATHPVPAEQHDDLLRQKRALENTNVSLRQRLIQLEAALHELTGIRQRGLPDTIGLIPARVCGLDAAPGRDSLLLGKGHLQKVAPGNWVASRLFVDAGANDGVRDQAVVLARECLIGWVEQTAPFTSRLVMLSDRVQTRPMSVLITPRDVGDRLPAGGDRPLCFALAGAGRRRMRVPDVPASLVATGQIRVGDLVTSDPSDPRLPVTMVIGRITELKGHVQEPVHYDAMVEYLYDPRSLSRVFIVDLSRLAGGGLAPEGG